MTITGDREIRAGLDRFSTKLGGKSRDADVKAGAAIVEEARARVPRNRGALFAGIETFREGEFTVVRVSAENDGFDYAKAVEFGTRASTSVFEADTFGDGTVRRGHHAATSAEPFFYPAVRQVLKQRGKTLAGIGAEIATEDGWNKV